MVFVEYNSNNNDYGYILVAVFFQPNNCISLKNCVKLDLENKGGNSGI